MRHDVSLKTGAAAAGLVLAGMAAVLVAVSIWAAARFESTVADLERANMALRLQGTADMMHDALRGDVYRALYDAASGGAHRDDVLKSATEHNERFVDQIARLTRLDLPGSLGSDAAALVEPVAAYGALGAATAEAAYGEPDRVAAMIDNFDARFADLEEQLDAFADAVEADGDRAEADAQVAMERVRYATGVAGIGVLVVLLGLQVVVRRAVIRPITAAAEIARAFAAGRYDVAVPRQGGAEIGDLMGALANWRQDALAGVEAQRQETARLAREAARQTRLVGLIGGFRGEVEALLSAVGSGMGRLGETSGRLSAVAEQAADRTGHIAAGSEEASANVAAVAGATEELVATVGDLAERIRQASSSLAQIAGTAESSNAEVAELAGRADRIGAVVGLIREVADQTNLLALNATIEAARAGEAGRGFAVVASEVKSLAGQTARATREIAEQVEGIQQSTRAAVASIGEIAARLRSVDAMTGAIAGAVSQQSAATGEIGRGMASAAAGAEAVAAHVGGVRGNVEETRTATQAVNAVAADVTRSTESLRRTVERFLADVAA